MKDFPTRPNPDWKGAGWYRFDSMAGDMMPEKNPGYELCGSDRPGWVNGTHPATVGEEKQVKICWAYAGVECWYSSDATIRHCGDYFLYNLREPLYDYCKARYCGSHYFQRE